MGRIARRPGLCRAVVRALILLAASPLLIFAPACSGPAPRPPDIVLIVLDTVRRDHLSTYGYSRKTSPRLSELRDQGRMYTNTHATGGWTVPSHASIFTGLYPVRHGATQERHTLESGFETLAEILRVAGYETAGVTGNAILTDKRGFSQGFDVYHESWRGVQKQDRDTNTRGWIEDFLGERDGDRPLFLFVNLIGPHTPYDSCGENCGAFGAEVSGGLIRNSWADHYRGLHSFTPAELDRLTRLYDAEILQADAILGRILAAVDRHLAPETTFVAVTSDHGENIGDHGHMSHVFSIYESTIQVPLIIRHPPRIEPGSREERPVQLLDLYPTILGVAGLGTTQVTHQGVDLFGDLDPDRPVLSEYYIPKQAIGKIYARATPQIKQRLDPYRRRIRSVIEHGWKFVWGSDGRHELYDLRTDPDELRNLIDEEAAGDRARALQQTLGAMLTRYGEGGELPAKSKEPGELAPLDAETEAELRELGYIN